MIKLESTPFDPSGRTFGSKIAAGLAEMNALGVTDSRHIVAKKHELEGVWKSLPSKGAERKGFEPASKNSSEWGQW